LPHGAFKRGAAPLELRKSTIFRKNLKIVEKGIDKVNIHRYNILRKLSTA
jgi:hypothetical protein